MQSKAVLQLATENVTNYDRLLNNSSKRIKAGDM